MLTVSHLVTVPRLHHQAFWAFGARSECTLQPWLLPFQSPNQLPGLSYPSVHDVEPSGGVVQGSRRRGVSSAFLRGLDAALGLRKSSAWDFPLDKMYGFCCWHNISAASTAQVFRVMS